MDTECVRLFVVAAETLNISAAGRQLGLAPAVASARLSKLEKQVGADLLRVASPSQARICDSCSDELDGLRAANPSLMGELSPRR